MIKPIIICLDFDGVCVADEFPKVGGDIGALRVLRKIVAAGHKIILWTMRSDVDNPCSDDPKIICQPGKYLTEALDWFKQNDIPLYAVNENPEQKSWTHSQKIHADLYIDDRAIGAPLVIEEGFRPFINWFVVEEMMSEVGLLPPVDKVNEELILEAAIRLNMDPDQALEIIKNRLL